MRYIILVILAALAAYGLFLLGQLKPGNLIIMYVGDYRWELSVIQFLALIFAVMFAIYLVFKLVRMTWKAPKLFSGWRTRRAHKIADAALGSGYLSLIKGDWERAERSLLTKSEASRVPYVNYLAAAQAAQEQGRLKQRDEYLNEAYKAAPKERLAIGLTKARLHQQAGQVKQAAATLKDIADIGHKNAQYTAMLMQTYQELGEWKKATALLPVARKQKALSVSILDDIYNESHTETLKNDDIETAWKGLPRDQRKRIPNIVLYTNHLIESGENSAAEKLIRSTLKSSWSDELVHLYGMLNTDKPAKLRRVVEGWLMARPENAELNLAAGQFAMQEKNYDVAKDFLQKSVELAQLPKAYALLGEVYETTSESGKALQLYRSGMLNLSQSSDRAVIEEALAPSEGELLIADHANKA